eukprot:SAG31_NODE_797_length_12029_cov_13.875692_3_plen_57_part_00
MVSAALAILFEDWIAHFPCRWYYRAQWPSQVQAMQSYTQQLTNKLAMERFAPQHFV